MFTFVEGPFFSYRFLSPTSELCLKDPRDSGWLPDSPGADDHALGVGLSGVAIVLGAFF